MNTLMSRKENNMEDLSDKQKGERGRERQECSITKDEREKERK